MPKTPEDVAKALGLGATGEPPCGELGPHDHGPLAVAVYAQVGKVVLNFGKSISWAAVTPEQALQLAAMLIVTAREIDPVWGRRPAENG